MSVSAYARRVVFQRDNYTCRYCGERPDTTLHIDHIYPRSKGGTDDISNLVTACAPCNNRKGIRLWIPTRLTCIVCGDFTAITDPSEVVPTEYGPLFECRECGYRQAEQYRVEVALDLEIEEFSDLALEQRSWNRLIDAECF